MMKVRMRLNLGRRDAARLHLDWEQCQSGSVVECDAAAGQWLIGKRWADEVAEPKQAEPIKAVPATPVAATPPEPMKAVETKPATSDKPVERDERKPTAPSKGKSR